MSKTGTCWVLTRSINEYDQDGEYLVAVFNSHPMVMELVKVLDLNREDSTVDPLIEHIRGGGGRQGNEYEWYYLREVSYGEAV